jgi:hypothetical protein
VTRLRKPRGDVAYTTVATITDPVRNPPNRITLGVVCAECRWPERCRRDRICWHAEKADIADDRTRPRLRRYEKTVSRLDKGRR